MDCGQNRLTDTVLKSEFIMRTDKKLFLETSRQYDIKSKGSQTFISQLFNSQRCESMPFAHQNSQKLGLSSCVLRAGFATMRTYHNYSLSDGALH